jgi:hypothetical protein
LRHRGGIDALTDPDEDGRRAAKWCCCGADDEETVAAVDAVSAVDLTARLAHAQTQ